MYKKKYFSLLIVVLSILVLALVLKFTSDNITVTRMDETYISGKQYSAMISTYTHSDTPLTTNISLNDETLIYDSDTNTFYYSVIEGKDSSYNPVVEVPNEENSELQIFAYGSPITDELISTSQPINLILTDGTSISESNLICTTLPVINVRIDDETVAQLGLDDTMDLLSYVGSSIYIYDNRTDFDGKTRSIYSDAKIRRHGQSTAGYPLKGYRFSLLKDKNDFDGEKVKENVLGLREDDDWVLSASYRDYEKIRNVFSMNLWHDSFTKDNEWNVNNSTEYRYVELFFNGHYHGLYAICYRIDQKEVKASEGESIFKKKDWTLSEFDTELTYEEYADGSGGTYLVPGYSLKYGNPEDFQTLLSLYINMNYATDPAVVRMTSDVGNSIDLWLYYKLTQAVDNIYGNNAKNMYVTIKHSDSGIDGNKLLFTPWDMDQTWRYTSEAAVGQYSMPEYDLPLYFGTVYRLLELNDPTIRDEIKARYAELRSGVWSDESMLEMLTDYEDDIYNSGAFVRTQAKYYAGSYNDSSVKLSEFKSYVLARLASMDAYINAL